MRRPQVLPEPVECWRGRFVFRDFVYMGRGGCDMIAVFWLALYDVIMQIRATSSPGRNKALIDVLPVAT